MSVVVTHRALGRMLDLRQQAVSLFAAAWLAILVLVVGVPVFMVLLMSLRTGFGTEGGPLTFANSVLAYTDLGTHEILLDPIKWIAYGTRSTNGVMIQVQWELEEARKVSGASTRRILGRIVLPLVASGLFNSCVDQHTVLS